MQQHQVLRPVRVIINNCGQTEQARAHKCPFHSSLAWQQVREPCATPPLHSPLPSKPLKRCSSWDFLVLVFETNPLEGSNLRFCVLTSCKDLIWDFVLVEPASVTLVSLLLGFDNTVGLTGESWTDMVQWTNAGLFYIYICHIFIYKHTTELNHSINILNVTSVY